MRTRTYAKINGKDSHYYDVLFCYAMHFYPDNLNRPRLRKMATEQNATFTRERPFLHNWLFESQNLIWDVNRGDRFLIKCSQAGKE